MTILHFYLVNKQFSESGVNQSFVLCSIHFKFGNVLTKSHFEYPIGSLLTHGRVLCHYTSVTLTLDASRFNAINLFMPRSTIL